MAGARKHGGTWRLKEGFKTVSFSPQLPRKDVIFRGTCSFYNSFLNNVLKVTLGVSLSGLEIKGCVCCADA